MTIDNKLQSLRGAIEKAPFFFHALISLLLGIGLSFIQSPYDQWFLIFPCFGVFYFLYTISNNKKRVFFLTFLFAIGYFVTGLNWIGNALLVEGNEYRWVWPLAVIALPTLLSLFTALFATIAHIISRKDTVSGFFVFCTLLAFSEFVRGYAFTGFPWNLYGYSWLAVKPMAQLASLIGPYGLTLLTVIWGCSAGFFFLKAQNIKTVFALFLVLVLCYGYGHWRLNTTTVQFFEDKAIHVVQPNIPQAEKWLPQHLASNFEKLVDLSKVEDKEKQTMILWPETAIPPSFIDNAAVAQRVRSLLGPETFLLSGALEKEKEFYMTHPTYHNSLIAWELEDEKPLRMYSKSHLVPFGEYIPFQKYIPLKPVARFTGFEKGNGPETMAIYRYPPFNPLICYEIIFPNAVVNKVMGRPDFLLTITNDAWYGDSAGPRQHLAQARFRAIEQGLPVVRSANTGISALIGPYGSIIKKLDLLQSGSIVADMPKSAKPTLYSRFGDYIFLVVSLLSFCFCTFFTRKRLS